VPDKTGESRFLASAFQSATIGEQIAFSLAGAFLYKSRGGE
jgi:hypothetical protein